MATSFAFVGDDLGAAITDREFALFRQLVADSSGIALSDAKRQLLVGRLSRRLQSLGLSRFREYYDYILRDRSGAELVRMIDLVSTNETHFFRERGHFDYVETRVIPAWRAKAALGERSRHVRVWSAAASTGQEAYSLGMLLLEHLPASDGWTVEILGTDISTRVLAVAEEATWPMDAKEIPPHLLAKYMLRGRGSQTGRMRAAPELRAVVRFQRLNLNDRSYAVPGSFDLIFCRNVLIYFSPEGRAAVVDRLAARLAAGGLLFVGHAESVHGASARLRTVMPTVYTTVD